MTAIFPEVKPLQEELKAAKEAVENGDAQGVIVAAEVSEGIRAASFKTLMILLAVALMVSGAMLLVPMKKSLKPLKYAVIGFMGLLVAVGVAMHAARAEEADKWKAAVVDANKQLAAENAAAAGAAI